MKLKLFFPLQKHSQHFSFSPIFPLFLLLPFPLLSLIFPIHLGFTLALLYLTFIPIYTSL
nr:MAG TPA: hypothetical protein [Caudoviricetes sp.]